MSTLSPTSLPLGGMSSAEEDESMMVIEAARETGSSSVDLSFRSLTSLSDHHVRAMSGFIEHLNLMGNPDLSSLPLSISACAKLTELCLRECGFSEVPESVVNIPNLRRLDMSDNNITEVNRKLASMPLLKWCQFDDNPLSEPLLSHYRAGRFERERFANSYRDTAPLFEALDSMDVNPHIPQSAVSVVPDPEVDGDGSGGDSGGASGGDEDVDTPPRRKENTRKRMPMTKHITDGSSAPTAPSDIYVVTTATSLPNTATSTSARGGTMPLCSLLDVNMERPAVADLVSGESYVDLVRDIDFEMATGMSKEFFAGIGRADKDRILTAVGLN